MLETIQRQAGPKSLHDVPERRAIKAPRNGQPLDGRLQRRTIFTQHSRHDLPPASLEALRGNWN